jgi:hypothetical protein
MPRGMPSFALPCAAMMCTLAAVCALSTAHFASATSALPQPSLTGFVSLASPADQHLRVLVRPLRVAVAVQASTPSPAAPYTLSFTLPTLADGDYVLELCGSSKVDYSHILLHVAKGLIARVEDRRDPLIVAGRYYSKVLDAGDMIVFVPRSTIEFIPSPQPWAHTLSTFFSNKLVLVQLVAVAFVIWFPRYVASLDPDMLAMLSGERLPDIGDPNSVLKKLLATNNEDQ